MIPYSSQESIKRITEVVTVVTVTEVTVFLEAAVSSKVPKALNAA